MNTSCGINTTECDISTPRPFPQVYLFGIFLNLLSMVEKFILIYLVVKLKTISRICKYIWVNEFIANIGINAVLVFNDILTLCFQVVLDFAERVVITITMRSLIMMSMSMIGANMYNIYLAFRSGFDQVSCTSRQIYVTIGVLWLWNFGVSSTVLLDTDMLLVDPNYLIDYKLTEYGIWIIMLQILNTFVIPQSIFFYSTWRIYRYNKQRNAASRARQQFDRGVRLAILIFKLNILRMALVAPIIVVKYFGYTLKQAGLYHPSVMSFVVPATFVSEFVKLPIFLLRNTELRNSCVKFRKKYCCVRVNSENAPSNVTK